MSNKNLEVNSNQLAIERTKLANQRTYLAYMRTGFAISGISGAFKKYWVVAFGIIMILGSLVQYYYINNKLQNSEDPNNKQLDLLPMIYVPLSLGALYLQFNK